MLNSNDARVLDRIREQTLLAMRDAIGDARDVAILDVPNQRNVGDSLIWAGELAYLKKLGLRIRYAADLQGYDPHALRSLLQPNGVVLLHGGGNFGDLWPGHQAHREKVIADLADYRIVQLPQSVYFRDRERAIQANESIAAHPDFTLLVREAVSLKRVAEYLPDLKAAYCPDMALGYEVAASAPGNLRQAKVLIIAREDREQASGLRGGGEIFRDLPSAVQLTDWGLHRRDPVRWTAARLVTRVNHKLVAIRGGSTLRLPRVPNSIMRWTLNLINSLNIDGALSLYRPASTLVVDRLHAHVLAVLLGLDHVVLDNDHRKIGAVYDDYTGEFTTAHFASSLGAARKSLESLTAAR